MSKDISFSPRIYFKNTMHYKSMKKLGEFIVRLAFKQRLCSTTMGHVGNVGVN